MPETRSYVPARMRPIFLDDRRHAAALASRRGKAARDTGKMAKALRSSNAAGLDVDLLSRSLQNRTQVKEILCI